MSEHPPVPPQPPQDQGPRQPAPSAPAAPAAPSDGFDRLLRSVPGRDWLAAVLGAVGGWFAAYVVAAIALLLTVAVAAAGSGGAGSGSADLGSSGSLGGSGVPDVQSLLSGVSVLLGAPAQLVVLADLGRLHGSGSIGLLGSGSGSVGVVPAVVLAAQVVLAVLLTRRIRSRVVALPQLLVTSVVSGLVLVALTTLTGLVLAIRFPAVDGVSIEPVHGVGLGSVLGSFLAGALTALLARPALLVRGNVLVGRVLGTVRVAASQLVVLVVVVSVVVAVVALVAQPSWSAALPVFIGNAGVLLTALGFLGGIGTSGLGSASSTASVFGGAGGWTWLVVLLVLVSAFVAGLALAVRRNDRVRSTLDWVVTPVVWLLGGVVLLVLGTLVVSYRVTGVSTLGGTGSVGITAWTPVVFLLWGAAIEVVARFVAPVLLPRLGGGVLLRTAKVVGTDPQPAVAWTSPVGAAPTVGDQPSPGHPVTGQPAAGQSAAGQSAAGAWAQAPGVEAPVGTPAVAGQQAFTGAPAGGQQPFVGAPAGGPQPFVGGQAPAPMSPKARKVLVRSLVAAGVVVVVVVAGAVTTGVLRANVWGPGATARDYVDAIARGDGASAATLTEAPSNASMLDGAVLKSAEDRPTDVRIGRVSTSGDSAYATVRYRQGGSDRTGEITLERTGTSFLVKDEWRVTKPLADRVSIAASDVLEGAPVTVAGKKVGTIENGVFESLAYPGSYQVAVGGTDYFTGGTKTVKVGAAAAPYVSFEPKATKALETDAEQYVSDLIDECATKTDIGYSDGCPWYGPYDADGAVQYTVEAAPELSVETSGSGYVEVRSTKDGTVAYSYRDYFGDAQKSEDSFDVDVYLKVEDGKLVSAY
ncbi:hypothetical protein JOE58_001267 [Curtobacterium luteum]|uniref:Uncharacterized protein n=1 Tax=Curtobacterium luteum TaxID=33881 RepID=A0A8H9GBS8_9MICO|nr:hypothetical protein [Curtobacterium luteum]MBM7802016.1 hypothetical protein [Curtobacterium luteum]NUU51290.1 hypothetical protein [Curtobacterium luteum]GGL08745.1 hypothetical protein GCM10009769_28500 [Curtobacterium luteum]